MFYINHQQAIEKRHKCRPDKAKFGEKAEFIFINEYVEPNFNAVWPSAIVFQRLLESDLGRLLLFRRFSGFQQLGFSEVEHAGNQVVREFFP